MDGDFWRFSNELYAGPGVADACIALQDDCGLDVNLLLFCAWAGANGRALGDDELRRLERAVAPWRENVIRPLRAVRRWLATFEADEAEEAEEGDEADRPDRPVERAEPHLRAALLRLELRSEERQQQRLDRLLAVGRGAASSAAMSANFEGCLALAGVSPTAEVSAHWLPVLHAAHAVASSRASASARESTSSASATP